MRRSVGETPQQAQNLRLDRHVERRGRLIGDDDARLGGQGQRDDDALSHSAGKLVGIVVDALLRLRNADLAHQRKRAAARFSAVDRQVRTNGVLELLADLEQGVEAGLRILEHRSDPAAAQLAAAARR